MTSKQLKFYQLFGEMCRKTDIATNQTALSGSISALLELDYMLAQDGWEYLATVHESTMSSKKEAGLNIGQIPLNLFYARAQIKCIKTVIDVPTIRRAVYMYNPLCGTGAGFSILTDAIVSSKTAEAEEILKCLVKNATIEYGAILKTVLERVFIELLKKSPTKKIELNKKQITLLLTYISKIKTDERAMLEQRIKETL